MDQRPVTLVDNDRLRRRERLAVQVEREQPVAEEHRVSDDGTREISAKHPETRVLKLPSFADDEPLFASIMVSAPGYVLKQVKSGDPMRAIRAVGVGDSLLDPSVTSALAPAAQRKHTSCATRSSLGCRPRRNGS